ncbi:MAG: sensor histidine kinase [Pseudolabrys sp.]
MSSPDRDTDISSFEAEETVRAIYQGAVDAVVVQGRNGPQIVTLTGADEPYRVLVDRMSDGALTMSADGTLLYVNRRLAELSGRPIESLVGSHVTGLFEDGCPVFDTAQGKAAAGRHECNLARPDGAVLPVSVWAGPIALGDHPATLVTITDLSVHRRAEEIAVAERFARSILEQATEAILVLDPAGRVTHASDAAELLAGGSPVGRPFSHSFPLEGADDSHGAMLERSPARLDALLASRPFHGIEVRLRGRDVAAGRTFLLSAGPLLDETKTAVGSIVTLTDITARKRSEEQQTMLVAELNHRVKNILAIVQSVAAQTLRNAGSLDTFNERFAGRLRALALAHDILTKTRWGGVELTQLLTEIVAPYRERVALQGPPLLLPSQAVVPLSMVLHELMTNAAKYGALSAAGRVVLGWERGEADAGAMVRMLWQESGGPQVAPRKKTGFGTTLIERVVSYDLDGSAVLDFDPDGLRCTLQFGIGPAKLAPEAPPVSGRALG